MSKKAIIITSATILLIIIAFFSYYFFWVKKGNPDATIRDAFPFGQGSDTFPIDSDQSDTEPIPNDFQTNGEVVIPNLRQISSLPVAGAIAFNSNNGTAIRYVMRGEGDIYEATTANLVEKKIAESLISTVYEAFWVNENSLIARTLADNYETIESAYLFMKEEEGPYNFNSDLKEGDTGISVLNLQKVLNKDPDTRVSEAGAGSPGNETSVFGGKTKTAVIKFQEKYSEEILEPQNLVEGTGDVNELTREKLNEIGGWNEWRTMQNSEENLFDTQRSLLKPDIEDLAVSKEKGEAFYLIHEEIGSSGSLLNLTQNTSSEIFNSPLKEWVPYWPEENTITLTTKAGNGIEGFMFFLNPNNRSTKRILGNIRGLTTLTSPDASQILYSESYGSNLNLYLHDVSSNTSVLLSSLKTLPEKCIWSSLNTNVLYCAVPRTIQGSGYPDIWYQGVQSFSDNLWRIDTETGTTNLIGSLTSSDGEGMDAIKPFLDPEENYFFFTNKKDLSLWSRKLTDDR